jgi:HAMP domain-containing protein
VRTKQGEQGETTSLPLLIPEHPGETVDVKAPDSRTVEARRRAEWPAPEHQTECERGPDWRRQEAPHEADLATLRGSCRPTQGPTARRTYLHKEGESAREGAREGGGEDEGEREGVGVSAMELRVRVRVLARTRVRVRARTKVSARRVRARTRVSVRGELSAMESRVRAMARVNVSA